MSGIRLFVRTGRKQAELLFAELERRFEDDGFALSINQPDNDDCFEVSVYLTDDDAGIRAHVYNAVKTVVGDLFVDSEAVPDIDWVSHVLDELTPVRAGRIVVHGAHNRAAIRPSDLPIEIEAGQAFGTGHHATTWGCLAMLQPVLTSRRPQSALDLGTGSAVLAIAIARHARIRVLATDIDPVAIRVAKENAAKNRAGNMVETLVATGFRHRQINSNRPYDLITANILARPLMRLAPEMARHLSSGGDAILSGILLRQRRPVIATYVNCGFHHVRTLERDGWVTIHMRR